MKRGTSTIKVDVEITPFGLSISKCKYKCKFDRSLTMIYEKYNRKVLCFLLSRRINFVDAEDLTQQVFVKLFREIEKGINENRKFSFSISYVYVITRNTMLDFLKACKNKQENCFLEIGENTISSDMPLPDRILQGKQDLEILLGHMDNQPLECQRILSLYRIHGMTSSEISRTLKISKTTVLRRWKDILCELQKCDPRYAMDLEPEKKQDILWVFQEGRNASGIPLGSQSVLQSF